MSTSPMKKHGLAAHMAFPPSLDQERIEERTREWMEELNPQGSSIETFLVRQAVRISFRLERCDAAKDSLIAQMTRESHETDGGLTHPNRSDDDDLLFLSRCQRQSEQNLSLYLKYLRKAAKYAKPQGT